MDPEKYRNSQTSPENYKNHTTFPENLEKNKKNMQHLLNIIENFATFAQNCRKS